MRCYAAKGKPRATSFYTAHGHTRSVRFCARPGFDAIAGESPERNRVSATGEKSTGLGLAIVSKIVQGHHGKIRVESAVGKGSTFFAALPVSGNRE